MAQLLRPFAALTEDLGLVLSINMVAYNYVGLASSSSLCK